MLFFKQRAVTTAFFALIILLSVAAVTGWGTPKPVAEGTKPLVVTKPMQTARAAHTATLLHDGSVLIVGGFAKDRESDPFIEAERYNPEHGVFTPAGTLTTGRQSHEATLLADGRVLITGGFDGSFLDSAELYDPATETFARTGSMTTGRIGHRASVLADGRVLITGGISTGMTWQQSAEVYDPATGRFTPVAPMTMARTSHTQTVLVDGTVLLTGGTPFRRQGPTAAAELFDPATGVFRAVGPMMTARHKHAAVLMEDERVLVVGGSDANDWRGRYDTAEIYDPATGLFAETGRLNSARFKLRTAVTLLTDGTVLVAGGAEMLEVFDPEAERFTPVTDQFDAAWFFSTATVLQDGRVLIAGGYDQRIESTAKAWIYKSQMD